MAISPPFLKEGDLILVLSPSGVVDKKKVENGIEILKEKGFKIEISKNTFNAYFKFGSSHENRLSDLQNALDHPEAKAIYCARGGFGITHILDDLDWTKFKENPKWIIGFSDITALLNVTYKKGFASLHASVLQGLSKLDSQYQTSIFDCLKGKVDKMEAKSKFNKNGEGTGSLIGGNLSLLVNQIGTRSELDYRGQILFIEEVAEPLYHIDRMFLQLKRANKLKDLAGLVVGQFTNLIEDKSIYGQSLEEIILAHCKEYDFPIGFNFPFGHGEDNHSIVHGAKVNMKVRDKESEISYGVSPQ
ncbi:LD-carboxypeptidase [Marivirga arenosa]|uniref:LD-carboxypeptidase n=1 Tax=Marivirga arenosa TaxID=3059076 RepID=A0AA51N8B3_9BACT|nr:LD-carboxypeptidase [Marivirga sp. ABR2-2]WMN07570.1 LD-carboxypeptidase [Marivirga sp. ABR2-2]